MVNTEKYKKIISYLQMGFLFIIGLCYWVMVSIENDHAVITVLILAILFCLLKVVAGLITGLSNLWLGWYADKRQDALKYYAFILIWLMIGGHFVNMVFGVIPI